ncbi:response regulator [Rhizobium helianthi]|uniref:Response regulator n=1 Tax=Rhizobium helianthi TaxID=1132695 RepID=A0ABW4M7W8_9HYPH
MTSQINDAAPHVILIVEDEPLQRFAAMDLIEDAGYVAVLAANATEAISILEARPDIRLVMTDVDMPNGIDGMRLAALIRDRWPPIKVIIISGHLADPGDQIPAETRFFSKPYREDRLLDTIRDMLG